MTRRKFIQKLIKTGSMVGVGIMWFARKTSPRRFIRAIRVKNYPGPLGPLRNIDKQGKWSG